MALAFLEELAARRRFGMKPGLDTIRALCAALGDPQRTVPAVHIAGTNGKGAVAVLVEAALRAAGFRMGRYTSPHLVSLNERFFLNGRPVGDGTLERVAERVSKAAAETPACAELTFFEALTAVAFLLYAEERVDCVALETGLGGRLDATNICAPVLAVITRIGLDHCDWLGGTLEKIAAEKAGIVKPGIPVVLGANEPVVRAVVSARAAEVCAPCFYAPEIVAERDVPKDLALAGAFNRENAQTTLAALTVLSRVSRFTVPRPAIEQAFATAVWPGRFQRIGRFLVDGAHNPCAARALVTALEAEGVALGSLDLIAGFCGDKDVDATLAVLRPYVRRAFAVRTANPRALEPEALARRMAGAGIPATPCASLGEALVAADGGEVLVCGSLFLAGEAVVALGAYPWSAAPRFDPSERLRSLL